MGRVGCVGCVGGWAAIATLVVRLQCWPFDLSFEALAAATLPAQAFDLEGLREVACKIHQLNSQVRAGPASLWRAWLG